MIFNSKSGWKWLSATLLPVLGFAGCGNPGDSPDLYGTPTSDYQFKGRVTDADGKPVEGIKVVSGIVEGDRVFHEDSVATDARHQQEIIHVDRVAGEGQYAHTYV